MNSNSTTWVDPYPWREISPNDTWIPTSTYSYTWYETPRPRCAYCDGLGHSKKPELCPRVKSISYFKDGSISKIEFHKMEE